ncbi:uncharacterized protein LOC111609654 isoform X1 [Xiphophorus maculatus]|uniref:uncharacterized protein LOC111609654 isoform X1 n=1 Tax=Xiphophorus maculatus TaxID=8083 RepID=UPI000C6DEA3A|nr:uncharacterized protein LOC111609654 isoform X1 [Xiphophorus maculatus]
MEHQQARVESSQSDYSQQIADNIQTLQTLALALNTGGNDFSQSPALSPARSSISDILNASEVSDYFRQINDAVRGLNDYISPQNSPNGSPATSFALDETFQNTESQSDYSQQIINSIQILQTIASALNTGENNFSQSPALSPARSPISDILNASEVSDYFRQIDDAVRGLNNCISPQNSPVGSSATSSSISLDEGFQNTESMSPSETVSAADDQAQQQQQRGGNLDQNQRIERQRFNNIEIRRSLSIAPPTQTVPDIAEFYTAVMNVLTDLANTARSIADRNDVVQLELVWGNISHHINISVTDNDAILPAFEEFLDELVQSNAELPSESNLELILQIVGNPTGGSKRKAERTLECELINKKRRHLYIVENTGNKLCFATSLAHVAHPEFTDKQALEQGRKWQHQAGLTDQTAVTFSDVAKFENILQRKIVVFHRTSKDRALSKFETDFQNRSNPCFLLLHNNHFYGIRNLAGFTGSRYICKFCYGGHNNSNTHHCQGYCGVCCGYSCRQLQYNPVHCDDCNRICRNSTCFDRHKEPRNRPHAEMRVSDCETIKFCSTCKRLYRVPMNKEKTLHICESKCVICGEKNLPPGTDVTLNDHQCYIQTSTIDDKLHDKLVFYDFETFVDQSGVHKPFLVCSKTVKGVEWHAYGLDCAQQFLLHFRRPMFKGHTFIAHNARGFDSYLLLNSMVQLGIKPFLIMQGGKVLCFTDPDYKLKFIDSLSFLTMKLSAMPKALGFHDRSKGYFPHEFSAEEHLKYVGVFPPLDSYGVKLMNPDERQKITDWYGEASKGIFDFEKESLHYCKNDVDILFQGCVKFREEFFKETNVDPFKNITIASACMQVFVTNFLPEKSLAIPSAVDYRRGSKTFSNASIQWLEWKMDSENLHIEHALNSGERKIGPYFVDGFAVISGLATIFSFNGCLYHACPRCFKQTEVCPLRKVPFEQIYAATVERSKILQAVYGVRVETVWEHEWDEMKKSDPGVIRFLEKFDAPEPLVPRNALYGGRTCALKLRFTAGPGESVHYVDFTSLYPYVNATCEYPLGHPTLIYKDFDDPVNYFGFIRATVYPPRGLFFPVLPYKTSRGKLVFTLCRTCADINNQSGICTHEDEARSLTGVWVSAEFQKALQCGYRLGKITEVWHFERSSSSIFKGYIHTFLKGKQEASGYPPEAMDQESRLKYVRDYQINQGIQLDAGKIEVNPAKRQVAKLCLNSFWGKFAQRNDLSQTSFVSDPDEYFNFFFSGKYVVKYFHFINPETCLIQWNYSKRCIIRPNKSNNIFIAAFTTAYARLKLFSCLERVQDKILYIDTDSLIYVVKDGESPLELGNYLGDLTDELGGDTIQEFVAAGPKSYAYQTKNQKKVVIRVKGITQTYECSERVNFDSIRELVGGYLEGSRHGVIKTPQHTIKRDKKGFVLRNATFLKRFQVVYDKRRLFPDGSTLPFGY